MNRDPHTQDSSAPQAPSPCHRFDAHLSDLLARELEPSLSAELVSHRTGCRRCQREWDSVCALIGELRALPVAAHHATVWSRIRSQLRTEEDAAAREDRALVAELERLPFLSSPHRVWRRIERRIAGARAPTRWPALLEVAALACAAALLLVLLVLGNDPVLALAERHLPVAWSARVAALEGTLLGSLFFPLLFSMFVGAVSMVSLPLLHQAVRAGQGPAAGTGLLLATASGGRASTGGR